MFTVKEVIAIIKSTAILSIIFGILLFQGSSGTGLTAFMYVCGIALLTVGISFVLHELAHKFTAIYFHCRTEFHASMGWLMFGLFTSFFGWVFLSPGGVQISNVKTKRQFGLISLAGPLVNILFALVFAGLFIYGITSPIIYYGWFINSWLALFNMIPILGFDGHKVYEWNKPVYFVFAAITLALYLAQYVIKM
jgi:Zn-dependent protease